MAESKDNDQEPRTVVSKLSGLVGVYSIFVFLSGWTYFETYYSRFGLYVRWLDLSVTEVLTKGFIILFEPRGRWLWLIYIFVLVIPVLQEVMPRVRSNVIAQLGVALVMLGCLPLTFYVAQRAGLEAAATNQGTSTQLPYIRFETRCGLFSGRLLFIKDHDFYVHDLMQDKATTNSSESCLPMSPLQYGHHFLSVYRSEDVHVVEIIESPTGG